MRVCAESGCPALTTTTRCPVHTRKRDRARGTSTERGYGSDHRRLRTELLPAALGKPCHFCGEPMLAGQSLALDHTEDRSGYRGIVHLSCNAADGGRRSHN
ncbi:endonuclease domain-containing protein [Aeromicrobium piscarium]